MHQTIDSWLSNELQSLKLKDARHEKRVKKVLQDWSASATNTIPQMGEDWADTKAMYRLLSNERVDSQELREAQATRTGIRMSHYREVLLLQDTMSVDLTTFSTVSGLGPLENQSRRGYFAHTTLATSIEGVPLGITGQQTWVRSTTETGLKHSRKQRQFADKESYKWLKGLRAGNHHLVEETTYIVVADREGDVYEYMSCLRPPNVELLQRVYVDRRVRDEAGKLWAQVKSTPVQAEITLTLPSRTKQPARTAECTLRFTTVTLKPPRRPKGTPKLTPMTMQAIWFVEPDPPADCEPIEWMLLTTLPVNSVEQAWRLVQFYTRRWIIERFHFVLKSGCGIEKRRLASFDRHDRLLALANFIAWRLLHITYLARIEPDIPCDQLLLDHEWKALYCYVHKTQQPPPQLPTIEQAVLWLAKLGGFLARKRDGYPGVKVLWRGWQRLHDIAAAYQLFHPNPGTLTCG